MGEDVEQQPEASTQPESDKTYDGGSKAGEEDVSEKTTSTDQQNHKR